MLNHYLQLVWNRRAANFLVMLEMFAAFVVLFVVITGSLYLVHNYRQPLGFSYKHVLAVSVDTKQPDSKQYPREAVEQLLRIVQTLRAMPNVEHVALANSAPYDRRGMWINLTTPKPLDVEVSRVSDDVQSVLGIELSQGRWFNSSDDSSPYNQVVINQQLATELFGAESPLGKWAIQPSRDDKGSRVVGVVSAFRKHGELMPAGNFILERLNVRDTSLRYPPEHILLKMRSGTTADAEGAIAAMLETLVRDWSFGVRPLTDGRDNMIKMFVFPLSVASIIAGFLLIMVALGLVGVVWQSVTSRTRELGVRRAFGATAQSISTLIVAEMFAVMACALVPAVLLIVQLPLVRFFAGVPVSVFAVGLAASLAVMTCIVGLCAWYPSRVASRVQPSEALRYE